ncbi:MAG: YceI family protein [Planctomycetota bacterium]|nr:YceI family protein [Planctomycetota bacterium]
MNKRVAVAAMSAAVALGGAAVWIQASSPASAQMGAPAAAEAPKAAGAEKYNLDPAHTSVAFKVAHVGVSQVFGLFTEAKGAFVLDKADASKSRVDVEVKVASVFTGQPGRDKHLQGPDFFNATEFPTINFMSTKFAAGGSPNTYEVTGDLKLHGVTKKVTVTLTNPGEAEFPPGSGKHRTGLIGEFKVKRSDFGMTNMIPAAGDEVLIAFGLEGIKQ